MDLSKHKTLRSIIVSLIVFAVAVGLYYSNVFEFLEHKTYDSLIRSTAEAKQPSEDIIIVMLDQTSLDWAVKEKGWNWPWPRAAFGDIASFFKLGGARSVAFDVLYTEPSATSLADDVAFANSIKKAGNVSLALQFGQQYGQIEYWHEGIKHPNTAMTGYSEQYIEKGIPSQPALFPIDIIAKATGTFGLVSSITDDDGTMRRARLFQLLDNIPVPSLGLSGLEFDSNEPLTFDLNEKKGLVSFHGKTIQVDKENSVYLRYRKDLESYAPYFAREILQSYDDVKANKEPLLNPSEFKDKYVFFGYYAPGLFDIAPTPISTKYPGVGIHITTLDNFLQDDFLNTIPDYISLLILLLCAFAGTFIVHWSEQSKFPQRTSLILSVIEIGIFIVAYYFATYFIFIYKYWIPFVCPVAILLISFLTAILVSYNMEGKQRRYLKLAFKQYLSPAVIEQILADPDKLKLGGERKEISIFFSDIQGFTSISEKLSPEDLTSLLNDYLTAMSNIILDSGGLIDKYEGDAIIAFWNAPSAIEDHSLRALMAGMKCQEVLEKMQDELVSRSGMPLYMRIGLNTGIAVVGNMGSNNRFDYTMLGDSVNLAARLEGLNKQFGTYTMCTKAMKEASEKYGTPFYMRELARVAVVGKREPVTVFEPMTKQKHERLAKVLPYFDKARDLFYEGKFAEAKQIFEKIKPYDRPAEFYSAKCSELLEKYPTTPADWAGVWVATTK